MVGIFFYAALGAWGLARSPDLTVLQLGNLWWSLNVLPTALLLVFLIRQVRAVGPLVVTFMVIALTGSVFALTMGERNQRFLQTVANFGFSLGLGATGVFLSIILVGFFIFALLGWAALIWIRKSYQAKKTNDQFLTLSAVWLLFGVVYSIGLVFEGFWLILAGPAAFLVWLAAVRAGFRLVRAPHEAARENVRLLLLRVFSLGRRSERLFGDLAQRWRHLGNLQLIAGPDLVTATVEPHEFLDFVSGRLRNHFINGRKALESRLADLDTRPDFDGRYRVNDFFCHDDAWQMTLRRLVEKTELILMDLRGFTPKNAGCVYELHELVNAAPLPQILLILDHTSDAAFLRQTLQRAWRSRRPDSPNRQTSSGEVRVFKLEKAVARGIMPLMEELCAMAEKG